MTIHDKAVETFAESFYRFHGALAPDFGCGSADDSEWSELTSNERRRLVAAARLAFLELQSEPVGSGGGELFRDWSSGGTEGRECGS
jgi:hypothetical protein